MPDQIQVRSTKNGTPDVVEVPTLDENWIAAYFRERAGYLAQGNNEGVEAVDAELARYGLKPGQAPRKVRRGGSQD